VFTDVMRWMQDHEYVSIRQMQGSMSRRAVPDPTPFERVELHADLQFRTR
jgi:dihydroorotate dehydrogenase (fumarate)